MIHRTLPLLLALLLVPLAPTAAQTVDRRIGATADPVAAAIAISQATFGAGEADRVLLGRADVFADNLAGAPLTAVGPLLLTAGGAGAGLSAGVADEAVRAAGEPVACLEQGDLATAQVLVLGGSEAVSEQAAGALEDRGFCVARLAGATRVETAVALAEHVLAQGGDGSRVLLARSDDWPEAATGGAAAARAANPVLVTPGDQLHAAVAAFLEEHRPATIVLLGGTAALSQAVEDAAAAYGEVARVVGAARDGTAAGIARDLFPDPQGGVVLANGYVPDGWVHALTAASLSSREGAPVLYAQPTSLPPDTAAYLQERPSTYRVLAGPTERLAASLFTATGSGGDLEGAQVALELVAELDSPLGMALRPDTGELYVAEQGGRVRVLGRPGNPTVLDLTDLTLSGGEQGLLGITFSPDSRLFFAHFTNNNGEGELAEFDVSGEIVANSRRTLMTIPDPANNHNGGHITFGPDGFLYLGLGDGGRRDDVFDEAQNTAGVLGSLLRIDPLGGDPYAIPAGNPFRDGGGAPEIYSYGLRNPWRFSFDRDTGDLWVADVGQGAWEEVDYLPEGTGANANFGWSFFEGSHPFCGPRCGEDPPPTLLPIAEHSHDAGWCSITGGFVYRGSAIPALHGAYVYGDLCLSDLRALTQEGGSVTFSRDLGVDGRLDRVVR